MYAVYWNDTLEAIFPTKTQAEGWIMLTGPEFSGCNKIVTVRVTIEKA